MKIPQRLSWGGITSITERKTQAREGWGSRLVQQKTCFAHSGGNHPNGASQLCDGFSRIDQLPTKECAGRIRLMRKRIYTQTARTTLQRFFENKSASDEGVCRAHSTDEGTDIHPNGASQLCDGFSRIDPLPMKECAGRNRLMRERVYTQTARQETGETGYLSAIRSFFPAPAIRSL